MTRTVQQLFDLSGKTALVTGGSRGLGLQMAHALGEAGAKVLLTSRKANDLQEAAAELKAAGIEADWIAADCADEADIDRLFQFIEIGVELAQNVFHTGEVLGRGREAVFRLTSALLVFGNPSRFFKEQTQLFRARLDDAADRALANDGVGARAKPGAQKHVLHVSSTHGLVIDEVAAVAITRENTLDGNFAKLPPLAAGTVIAVVERQLHTGAT